jgi:hypothetical protein
MFGGGIYFAESPEEAKRKALLSNAPYGDRMVIRAHIWMGWMLEVPGPMKGLTKDSVVSYGCHSVRGKDRTPAGYEFVVYDYRNVRDMCQIELC